MNVLNQVVTDRYAAYHGDCIDVLRGLPDASAHYSIFSPPFASLYTYSASPRDMGNCKTHEEFYEHFRFLIPELYRVIKPGRLLSFHCMLLPTSKSRDGFIGLTDFRGLLIKAFQDCGWVYHSEVVIWKDPVQAMQRTKARGLLYKELKKDSVVSRQGIADYLVTMRKPGDNTEPVTKDPDEFPVKMWQHYASPVWVRTGETLDETQFAASMADIHPGETLQYRSARDHEDERHICPLQLEVIRRAVKLWTNPNDVVLTPFGGIGSEGYVALQEGRRAICAELKDTYFKQLCANLKQADAPAQRSMLFEAAS